MAEWIEEYTYDYYAAKYRAKAKLFSEQSPYQLIEIYDVEKFGKMLVHDGCVMITEWDEFIYHEMIAHVPLFVHPHPRRVLVIGGGDGGTVREILRHPLVERVVLAEIDAVVVRAAKEFFPAVSFGLDDPRCDVRICDGVRFVQETEERFDIVIVDSTDPVGPAEPLFDTSFYADVQRILTRNGICVAQAESPHYYEDIQAHMLKNQSDIFDTVAMYYFVNLTYPGGFWCFSFASKGVSPTEGLNIARIDSRPFTTRYYNAAIHQAAFVLPEFLRQRVADILRK